MLSFLQYADGFVGHVHRLYPSGEFDLRTAAEKVDDETLVILNFHGLFLASFNSSTFFSNSVYSSGCLPFKCTDRLVVPKVFAVFPPRDI